MSHSLYERTSEKEGGERFETGLEPGETAVINLLKDACHEWKAFEINQLAT